jgi:hypothetical protein
MYFSGPGATAADGTARGNEANSPLATSTLRWG